MSHPGATPSDRHKVVIIGSGFGGLTAAKALKRADVDIKIIAKTTHHLFQPLLYQVATGIISSGEIAPPTRMILRKQKNAQVLLGEVTHIDLAKKTVRSKLLGHTYVTPYDTLDRRRGCRPVVLRQRPFRRVRAGHEDDRRRAGTARAHPRCLRAGRAVQRPGTAREAADLRRRRRRSDRCGNGRADRRTRRPHAQGRVPAHRFHQGAGDPAGRRTRGAAADGREARQEGAGAAREDGRRDPAQRNGHRRRPQRHHGQGFRRHHSPYRVRDQGVVGRSVGQPAGQADRRSVRRRGGPRRTGQGAARPVGSRLPERLRDRRHGRRRGRARHGAGRDPGRQVRRQRDQGRAEGRRPTANASRSSTSTRGRWRRCRDSPRWPRSARSSSAASSPGWRGWCCT